MKKIITSAMLILSAGFSGAVLAEANSRFSYDYIDLNVGIDPGQLQMNVSNPLGQRFTFIGGFGSKFDGDYIADAGLRFHTPLAASLDFVIDAKANVSDRGKKANTKWGGEALAGVRFAPLPKIQLHGMIGAANYGKNGKTKSQFGGHYQLTRHLSFGAQGEFAGFYGDQVMLLGRYTF